MMFLRPVRHSCHLLVLFLLSVSTYVSIASPRNGDRYLQHSLEVVEREHASLCSTRGGDETLDVTISSISEDIRREIGQGPSGPDAVGAFSRRIFGQFGVRGSPDLKDPCNLLPSRVLERKQGYCVGIASLYLLVAERLNLPIFAVATPSHVFLRYDDGTSRINIETLQQGANIPDEQYIREQKIPQESIRPGIFMRNLTTNEFLAQVHNNLGVIYSERQDFKKAAREYEAALDLDSRLAATLYNWGNDLLRQGLNRKAIRRFSKSLGLYPTDVWALNNRGLAYLKAGKQDMARRDFQEALRIDPGFEQARKNLEGLHSSK
jgi:regulator of sirC expression with transglutaminase-like and TPR domain